MKISINVTESNAISLTKREPFKYKIDLPLELKNDKLVFNDVTTRSIIRVATDNDVGIEVVKPNGGNTTVYLHGEREDIYSMLTAMGFKRKPIMETV